MIIADNITMIYKYTLSVNQFATLIHTHQRIVDQQICQVVRM